MHLNLSRLLREATRLTREGDLHGATRTIQEALHARGAPSNDDTIDVQARVVPDAPEPAAPALPPSGPALRDAPAAPASPAAAPEAPTPPVTPPPSATPEAFVAGRFGGPDLQGRDYKLYVPPNAAHAPRPLVVMLHGCTQNADDFAAGTRMNELAREHGCFVLYPQQSDRANPQRCWNWFKPSHQDRTRGETMLVAGMVRQVMAQHAIDPKRIYVAGLSAGGALAALVAQAHPGLFAAVGVHSGLAAGAANDLSSALKAMKQGAAADGPLPALPAIVVHGDADGTVHPRNGEQVIGAPAGWLAHDEEVQRPGQRRATRRVWRDAQGRVRAEHWSVHGGPHAWSGGHPRGSHTDPRGPDASAEMLRFFLEHPRGA